MPLLETKGAASAQGFGFGFTSAVAAANYIEDVFQTWLRTGTGASATVTTGLNASINKSLVWTKSRSAATDHKFTDTVRGATKALVSNSAAAETTDGQGLTAFSSTGYTIGTNTTYNNSGATYVDWQFVATPKFFDVVTYTGNGSNRTIAHSLGSVPGCIIVKRTDTSADWQVYHRSNANTEYVVLNSTAAKATGTTRWNSTTPTSTEFSLGTDTTVNASGGTYVAYLFAHDAGGFGASGSDNVISCGSTDGVSTVNLGYEPQWVLIKKTNSTSNWTIIDTMRGWTVSPNGQNWLYPNLSNAEGVNFSNYGGLNATGFSLNFTSGDTYIYIAIRRGPMRTPTTGTSVFSPIARTGDGSTNTVVNVGFPTDFFMFAWRSLAYGWKQHDRLRGFVQRLSSDQNGAESNSGTYTFGTVNNTGYTYGSDACLTNELNGSGVTTAVYAFGRAPGFFDVVCYTGTGANRTVSHNLGVVPELIIFKERSGVGNWLCYAASLGATKGVLLNSTNAETTSSTFFNDTAPTASVFTCGTSSLSNSNLSTYVAYLFATVAGVSKVGSYTGTGTTLQVNCGFTGGARFVLIKRTDSTGDWYVWDSARGIVAGNDPYLLLNSTAAEVTSTDYIDTFSSGFEISSTAPAAINANGGTFIFLAIA